MHSVYITRIKVNPWKSVGLPAIVNNMNKKLLITSIVLLALLSGVVYLYVFSDNTANQSTDTNEVPSEYTEEPITERGVITCIPKIGSGPQTMECALGLQNAEGTYFGLRFLSDHDENFALVSPEITVEVTGLLIHEEMFGPDGNRYDTKGIIEIKTISEI